MLAVKCSRDGIREGGGAEIFGEHPRPRHGLQRAPVCASSRQQHDNQQSVADPIHHRWDFSQIGGIESRAFGLADLMGKTFWCHSNLASDSVARHNPSP